MRGIICFQFLCYFDKVAGVDGAKLVQRFGAAGGVARASLRFLILSSADSEHQLRLGSSSKNDAFPRLPALPKILFSVKKETLGNLVDGKIFPYNSLWAIKTI